MSIRQVLSARGSTLPHVTPSAWEILGKAIQQQSNIMFILTPEK